MKKFISIILAVVLGCSMFGVTAFAETLSGDANADGKITAIDARIILQVVAGLKTDEDTTLYDINADGDVSAVDARIVLQIVAGLTEHPDTAKKDAENLAYFVKSLNGVKENATSVTLVNNKLYNYNDYIKIHPMLEALYNGSVEAGSPTLREELLQDFSDEANEVNVTYEGEDIALAFPPMGGTCNLTMDDISNISFEESGEYYIVEVTVKGKMNPARNESVGNVASIIIKEDFEAEMTAEELENMSIDCDYKDAVVNAKIEKATGNMVEYSVDYPMILMMYMTGSDIGLEMGMGFYEEWTATY